MKRRDSNRLNVSLPKGIERDYSRIALAVTTLSLCALVPLIIYPFELLFSEQKSEAGGRVNILQDEHAFSLVGKSLPNRGIVGYVSNYPADDRVRRIYTAQYALTPLIVDNSVEHRFVIGDYYKNNFDIPLTKDNLLSVKKDFGNGLVLFEREFE